MDGRCGSGERRGAYSLSGGAGLSLGGGDGVIDRLLRRHVRSLPAAHGRCARRVAGRRFCHGCIGGRRGRGDRWINSGSGTLAATRSRGRRCGGPGKAGALLALPSCPNP